MKKYLLSLILLAFFSCKKKNPESITNNYYTISTPVEVVKISLPIIKGSYWIYDVDYLDVFSLSRTPIARDSIIAERDTIINGKTFTIIKKYTTAGTYIFGGMIAQDGIKRDSAGYNVYSNGFYLNQGDFESTEIRAANGGYLKIQLLHSGTVFTPAAKFMNTINYCVEFQPVNLSFTEPHYLNNYFSDGVGLIKSTWFYVQDPNHFFENNLIRYKIN